MSEIQVAVDVGSTRHRVAIGAPDGKLLAEFDIPHNPRRVRRILPPYRASQPKRPVAVAMEGYYARPLDRMIVGQGFRLYSVNNLKLARYKEIFRAHHDADYERVESIPYRVELTGTIPVSSTRSLPHMSRPDPVRTADR